MRDQLTDYEHSTPVRAREPAGRSGGDYALIRRAIAYLTANFKSQPSLDDLAVELGLSATQCQKLFKRWCGLSPKEFVGALSVDHAREMLRGAESVLSTSLETGLSGGSRLYDLFVSHEAMPPGIYKSGCAGLDMALGGHPTPFGTAVVAATAHGLAALAFVDEDSDRDVLEVTAEMRVRWPAARFTQHPQTTQPYIDRIFDEEVRSGARDVQVVMIGTDFEVRVWQALTKIPMGRAVSYGDLARYIGKPNAARAVGSAVGRNPLSFVVPCHRVLRGDGGLGGYHWGVTRKQAIIGWEAGRLQRARLCR